MDVRGTEIPEISDDELLCFEEETEKLDKMVEETLEDDE